MEEVCVIMRDLNITMDSFKEHILSLLMCGEEEEFNNLPVGTKSMLTKVYNKLCSSSVKRAKKTRTHDDYKTYHMDPDFCETHQSDDSSDDESGDEEPEIVAVNVTKQPKGKPEPTVSDAGRGRGRGRGSGRGGGTAGSGAGRGRGRGESSQFNSFRGRGGQYLQSPYKR